MIAAGLPGRRQAAVLALSLLLALVLGGCATAPASAPATAQGDTSPPPAQAMNPADPWERWNRKVYAFNDAIDRAVVKPVAQVYHDDVPRKVRQGVDNVLGNIGDVWSAINNILQGKVGTGLNMGMRVLVNTTFGLAGLLDPATEMRLTRHQEDFGQTLGVWGFGPGPFLELPLLGPSTVRDTAGLTLDLQASPSALPPTSNGRYAVAGIVVVDKRSELLETGNLIDRVALDRYSFIRDAYLAQRRNAVYDGAPPMETFDDSGSDTGTAAPGAAASAALAASSPSAAAPAASSASAAAR